MIIIKLVIKLAEFEDFGGVPVHMQREREKTEKRHKRDIQWKFLYHISSKYMIYFTHHYSLQMVYRYRNNEQHHRPGVMT